TLLLMIGNRVLQTKITEALKSQEIGSLKLTTSEVDVNLLKRKLVLHKIEITDSVNQLNIVIPEIIVKGVKILPYIFSSNLNIGHIELSQPHISINLNASDDHEDTSDEPPSCNNFNLTQVLIENLAVNDVVLLLEKSTDNMPDTVFTGRGMIYIHDLLLINNEHSPNSENLSAKGFNAKIFDIAYNIPGDIYRFTVDSVLFDTYDEELIVDNLKLSSLHSKYGTGQFMGVETDWFDISLPKATFYKITFEPILTDSVLTFRKAVLEGLDAHIFRDKRQPFPDKPDTKLPIEMLNSLPVAFHSDSILITDAQVVYEEHSENSNEPGMVTFNNLYASIYNLSTLTDSIKGQTAMSARAMVMNEALLQAEFVFPNNLHPLNYSASGNLEPVELAAFNRMLIPSAHVNVDDGQLKSLDFKFTYNEDNSDGKLIMEYENLNIKILDPEDGSSKRFKTFITETFVLKQNNLKEKNNYQEGTISFERDKKRSVFNYWWKSLFSGIKDILAF
ncbi:MAG TPA: hypothetical protein VFD91_00880, partial [Mariniphaga sp.]|nr:hypothetical protein [Mariniphaga sp.]